MLPDQFIELGLVGLEASLQCGGVTAEIGRPDGFVGFLRILRLARIEARLFGDEPLTEGFGNRFARGRDRFRCHLDAVGSHIGDEADSLAADVDSFIEALGCLHCP